MKTRFIAVIISLTCLLFCGCPGKKSDGNHDTVKDEKQLRVVFVYPGPVEDSGWTYAHDRARINMERDLPFIKTSIVESVTDSNAEQVLNKCAQEQNDVIVGTSQYYSSAITNASQRSPKVIFLHCSGDKTSSNLASFFGRMYQARYLTGLVAGSMTKTDKIGYVASQPTPEVIRGINAFTIGVRKVNPKAKVHVLWTNTWYDPIKERDTAEALLDQKCDIIAQHQDSPTPQQAAQERNCYSIGYNSDMSGFAPKAHLVSAVWNWDVYYRKIFKEIHDDTWEPENYWGGLKDKIVDITPLASFVPEKVRQLVDEQKKELIEGTFDVFDGPVKNQKGEVVIKLGEKPTDEQLWNMNYFVEGVEGKTTVK